MISLWLYFPVALAILLVLEACRSDDPRQILRRGLTNLGWLTLALGVGSVVVYFINRYL